MLYIDAFADNISGLEKKTGLFKRVQRQLPASDAVPLQRRREKSDGGYAVADYRTVQPSLGTMEDLAALSEKMP